MMQRAFTPTILAIVFFSLGFQQTAVEKGKASYYADKFKGKPTASGEKYLPSKMTAAHKSLPFGTMVEVVNLKNDKSVKVRINDRGPFIRGRIIDLSKAAAKKIDLINDGVVNVEVRVIKKKK